MEACVELAKETAADVARRFELPVYLYEEAASTPARRNLEDIRRGEFEGLAAKMLRPEWAPDYGPSVPHPSGGATVMGARMPLSGRRSTRELEIDPLRAPRESRGKSARRVAAYMLDPAQI